MLERGSIKFVLLQHQPRLLPLAPQACAVPREAVPVNMHSDHAYTASQATTVLDVHTHDDSVPTWAVFILCAHPNHSRKPARICSCAHLCGIVLRLQASSLHLLLQLSRADVLCENTDGSPHYMLPALVFTCGHVALTCLGGCSSRD